MNKKFLIPPIIILIIVIIGLGSQSNPSDKKNVVFHITLASPELYDKGVYSSTFIVEKGEYKFRFVPNGDSPQNLSISLKGDDFEFSENFVLNGTLHETGISEYYTWDYDGQKVILIPTQKELSIKINPNENLKGSVSVDIIRN
ncbi:MAG: hypothetical protein OEL77_02585 [Nitrosopumilus sp.]|nr:hypothetical protein [Nitrosopumilus sp.]MDH3384881.1 hypothetical protein [Nitrosopumilus sp.]